MTFEPDRARAAYSTLRMSDSPVEVNRNGHEGFEDRYLRGNGKLSKQGILSRTLVQSPSVQTILPARIRSKLQNDVIFVGETFVQVHEFIAPGSDREEHLQANGHLEEVAMKSDFSSKILSASVIGSSDLEAEDFPDEIKQEQDSSDHEMDLSDDVFPELPPQILALVLDSKEVLFLYGQNHSNGLVTFHVSVRALPQEVFTLDKYGEHLAVDPGSRAMAVGAALGHFGILALKSVNDMKHGLFGIEYRASLMPIMEERFFRVDGIILKMDFLLPPADKPDSAILLLLVSKDGLTHVILYGWDTTLGLNHSISPIGCSGQQLHSSDTIPLMLIPSTLNTSFIVVCEHGLSSYSNILGKKAYRKNVGLPQEQSVEFKNSSASPLWVQWARPERNIHRRRKYDEFYLCREDGLVHFLEIVKAFGAEDSIRVALHFTTGSLNCNIDRAFAIMGGNVSYGADVLIAGGNMSDGGVFNSVPRGFPSRIQTLSNWAPVTDLLVVKSQSFGGSSSSDRLFACSGRGEGYGTVTELRHGIDAKIGLILEQDDASSITSIWVLPDRYHNQLVLLSTLPEQSTALIIDATTLDIESAEDDIYAALDLTGPTLAAAVVRESTVFQVTESTIRAGHFASNETFTQQYPELEPIRLATIVDGEVPVVVTVSHMEDLESYRLCVRTFRHQDKLRISQYSEHSTSFSTVPTSICAIQHDRGLLICVGFTDGSLSLWLATKSGLVVLTEYGRPIRDMGEAMSQLNSLAFLEDTDATLTSITLLCGFRNGLLASLHFDVAHKADYPAIGSARKPDMNSCTTDHVQIDLKRRQEHRLGVTPLTIVRDASDSTAAFVACDKLLLRVSLLPGGHTGQYSLHDVWFTDRNNPSCSNSSVHALARLPTFGKWSGQGLERALICVVSDGFLFSSCGSRSQTVPRRLPVLANPFRLCYLEHLRKMAVGVEIVTRLKSHVRCVRPAVEIIDIEPDNINPAVPKPFIFGKVGERITCMLLWTPRADEDQYGMLIVGTRADKHTSGTCDGRLIYLTADNNSGQLQLKRKRTYLFSERPIYSLASFGTSSLIVGLGQSLLLQTLDFATKKWRRHAEHRLPSPALQITVAGSDVQVTTAQHSMLEFQINENRFIHTAAEQRARSGITHIVYEDKPVMAVSGVLGGVVVGFARGGARSLQPVYEAHLPHIVTRLRQVINSEMVIPDHDSYCGSTIDGVIYHFTILSETEWSILHFIQMLSIQHENCLPRRLHAMKSLRRAKSMTVQPSDMHIDGDLLEGIVSRGSEFLQDLLGKEESGSLSETDAIFSAREKVAHFSRLVDAVLGPVENPIMAIMEWMTRMLGVAV